MLVLHKFDDEYIDQDLSSKLLGEFTNTLFYNCIFDNLTDVKLIRCELNRSKIKTNTLENCRNVSVTLDCKTFANVELSEFLFDYILLLLAKSKGNDTKRRKLLEIVGKEKARQLLEAIKDLD